MSSQRGRDGGDGREARWLREEGVQVVDGVVVNCARSNMSNITCTDRVSRLWQLTSV